MNSSKLMTSLVFAVIAVASASAQTGAVRVDVPFSFTMGKQTLAAGTYKVAVNGSLLQVARMDGAGLATVSTNLTGEQTEQNTTPRLIFHRYNDHYFLSVVWIGEINQGHELYVAPAELEYARAIRQEQMVVLASKRP